MIESTTASAPETTPHTEPEQAVTTVQTDAELLRQIQDASDKNVNPGDLAIARLAIMQSNSPEISDQVHGYKIGMLVDNITRQILTDYIKPPWLIAGGVDPNELHPEHCLLVAAIFKLPSEYIKWIPRDERTEEDEFAWEWKTLDLNDPKVKAGIWRSFGGTYKGRKPPVTVNTNFLLAPIDLKTKLPKCNALVGTFSRTSAPAAKQLASMLASHKAQGLMPWDRCYWIYTKQDENADGKFQIMQIARGPLLREVAEEQVRTMIFEHAKALSQPGLGLTLQTMMINAAFFGEDSTVESDLDSQAMSPEEEDPFKAGGAKTF